MKRASAVHISHKCPVCGFRTVEFSLWGGKYRACGTCDTVKQIQCEHQQEEIAEHG